MTITADIATTTTGPRDHAISVETAADVLAVQPATVRRYLRSGRLAPLAGGVSADSVAAYAARRAANVARTRAVPGWRAAPAAPAAPVGPVEAAAAMWAEAARLEALARDLKAQARPVLEEAGQGLYGRWHVRFTAGRLVQDTEAVNAFFWAVFGAETPKKRCAPSPKVTPAC